MMEGIVFSVLFGLLALLFVLLALADANVYNSQPCSHVNPFLTKEDAAAFTRAKRTKRQGPHCAGLTSSHPDCSVEHICECNKLTCVNENTREMGCKVKPCPSDKFCFLSVPCPGHYETACQENIIGVSKSLDPDETPSNPASHLDPNCLQSTDDVVLILSFTDTCKQLYPPEGDIIFVADSSISEGQANFDRQKQYMKDFIRRFPIGPKAFQVAVVSFSFTATVHCHLNTISNSQSLLGVIDKLSYTGGPSYTGAALKLVRENVLTVANGMRTKRGHYVVVLTDGMSSNITDTGLQARLLKNSDAEVIVVAFGAQINHAELMAVASERLGITQIYTSLLPDALYLVLKRHMPNCPDCSRNSSDVILLLDASMHHSRIQNANAIDALKTFVEGFPIGPNNAHVSYIKYAKDVSEEFDFTFSQTVDKISMYLGQQSKQFIGQSNLKKALDHVTSTGFDTGKGTRTGARKFVVVFIHGESDDLPAVKSSAEALKRSGVTLAVVGIGYANMTTVLELASDPALAFTVGENVSVPYTVLRAMASSMEFDVCE